MLLIDLPDDLLINIVSYIKDIRYLNCRILSRNFRKLFYLGIIFENNRLKSTITFKMGLRHGKYIIINPSY